MRDAVPLSLASASLPDRPPAVGGRDDLERSPTRSRQRFLVLKNTAKSSRHPLHAGLCRGGGAGRGQDDARG